jgi:hypothetical protein
VCGTIDIEKALSEGVKAFEPGLLAKANRGILYVDEVRAVPLWQQPGDPRCRTDQQSSRNSGGSGRGV